ncbi:MAG: cytochrome c3 family protein [Candidatus Riflebacteria bacterium]|nr:cytochrome c3 family protein [Candidatus Riflebacteria bacterium]
MKKYQRSRRLIHLILAVLFMTVFFTDSICAIVCIDCHSTQTGRALAPVNLWKTSIHAENGVFCNSCHGGDPSDAVNAMSPSRGFLGAPKRADIPKFCGKCHVGVLENYLASAHGKADLASGPVCIDCHGSHAAKKASIEIINEQLCSKCHSYEGSRILKNAFKETEDLIDTLQKKNSVLKMEGFDVEGVEKGIFSSRNDLHSVIHEVNIVKVKESIAKIKPGLDKAEASHLLIDREKSSREKIGVLAISIIFALALILHFFRKSFDDPENKSQ